MPSSYTRQRHRHYSRYSSFRPRSATLHFSSGECRYQPRLPPLPPPHVPPRPPILGEGIVIAYLLHPRQLQAGAVGLREPLIINFELSLPGSKLIVDPYWLVYPTAQEEEAGSAVRTLEAVELDAWSLYLQTLTLEINFLDVGEANASRVGYLKPWVAPAIGPVGHVLCLCVPQRADLTGMIRRGFNDT